MPKSRVCSIYDATGSHENILFFSVRKLKYCSTQKDYYDLRILGKWLALERGKSIVVKAITAMETEEKVRGSEEVYDSSNEGEEKEEEKERSLN